VRVIITTNMKLIVKNRAGAKVLPDGLEVKDVRIEIRSRMMVRSLNFHWPRPVTSRRHSVDTNAL